MMNIRRHVSSVVALQPRKDTLGVRIINAILGDIYPSKLCTRIIG